MRRWIIAAIMALATPVSAAPPIPASRPMPVGERVLAPMNFTIFCLKNPARCAAEPPQRIALDPDRWRELEEINTLINRAITPVVSGSPEAWSDRSTAGDCDDFALTKRSVLIDRGWPPSAVLLAVADTPEGKSHLVTLVVTDSGDYVLDNLHPRVRPWEELPYRWRIRMTAENPKFWKAIEPFGPSSRDREASTC